MRSRIGEWPNLYGRFFLQPGDATIITQHERGDQVNGRATANQFIAHLSTLPMNGTHERRPSVIVLVVAVNICASV
jgi:hypothetical protein